MLLNILSIRFHKILVNTVFIYINSIVMNNWKCELFQGPGNFLKLLVQKKQ